MADRVLPPGFVGGNITPLLFLDDGFSIKSVPSVITKIALSASNGNNNTTIITLNNTNGLNVHTPINPMFVTGVNIPALNTSDEFIRVININNNQITLNTRLKLNIQNLNIYFHKTQQSLEYVLHLAAASGTESLRSSFLGWSEREPDAPINGNHNYIWGKRDPNKEDSPSNYSADDYVKMVSQLGIDLMPRIGNVPKWGQDWDYAVDPDNPFLFQNPESNGLLINKGIRLTATGSAGDSFVIVTDMDRAFLAVPGMSIGDVPDITNKKITTKKLQARALQGNNYIVVGGTSSLEVNQYVVASGIPKGTKIKSKTVNQIYLKDSLGNDVEIASDINKGKIIYFYQSDAFPTANSQDPKQDPGFLAGTKITSIKKYSTYYKFYLDQPLIADLNGSYNMTVGISNYVKNNTYFDEVGTYNNLNNENNIKINCDDKEFLTVGLIFDGNTTVEGSYGIIKIDNECIKYTGVSGTNSPFTLIGVTRNVPDPFTNATTNDLSHTNGTTVYRHFNKSMRNASSRKAYHNQNFPFVFDQTKDVGVFKSMLHRKGGAVPKNQLYFLNYINALMNQYGNNGALWNDSDLQNLQTKTSSLNSSPVINPTQTDEIFPFSKKLLQYNQILHLNSNYIPPKMVVGMIVEDSSNTDENNKYVAPDTKICSINGNQIVLSKPLLKSISSANPIDIELKFPRITNWQVWNEVDAPTYGGINWRGDFYSRIKKIYGAAGIKIKSIAITDKDGKPGTGYLTYTLANPHLFYNKKIKTVDIVQCVPSQFNVQNASIINNALVGSKNLNSKSFTIKNINNITTIPLSLTMGKVKSIPLTIIRDKDLTRGANWPFHPYSIDFKDTKINLSYDPYTVVPAKNNNQFVTGWQGSFISFIADIKKEMHAVDPKSRLVTSALTQTENLDKFIKYKETIKQKRVIGKYAFDTIGLNIYSNSNALDSELSTLVTSIVGPHGTSSTNVAYVFNSVYGKSTLNYPSLPNLIISEFGWTTDTAIGVLTKLKGQSGLYWLSNSLTISKLPTKINALYETTYQNLEFNKNYKLKATVQNIKGSGTKFTTTTEHKLSNRTPVVFSSVTPSSGTGIQTNQFYYVVGVTAKTPKEFKLSTTVDGPAINLSNSITSATLRVVFVEYNFVDFLLNYYNWKVDSIMYFNFCAEETGRGTPSNQYDRIAGKTTNNYRSLYTWSKSTFNSTMFENTNNKKINGLKGQSKLEFKSLIPNASIVKNNLNWEIGDRIQKRDRVNSSGKGLYGFVQTSTIENIEITSNNTLSITFNKNLTQDVKANFSAGSSKSALDQDDGYTTGESKENGVSAEIFLFNIDKYQINSLGELLQVKKVSNVKSAARTLQDNVLILQGRAN